MKAQLNTLLELQNIDLALDAIQQRKGALPKQIADLDEKLKALEAQKDTRKGEVAEKEEAIGVQQAKKKEAEELVKKYREEQLSASDSRSYDTITKEIALQELEMQLAQKNIKSSQQGIKEIKEQLTKIRAGIREKKERIKMHKQELSTIQSEVQEEEDKLKEKRVTLAEVVDKSLYHTYEDMRKHLTPPHVVTQVKEDACGGCFYLIPPQQQAIILEGKKMVQCEHCNRILGDVIEEEEKTKKRK